MPHVLIIIDHGEERRFEIVSDLTTMGRSPENDIQISDSLASRFHCQFERTPEGLKLVDLESQNGTNVNGKKVNSKKLTTDDLVEIGDVTIQLSLEPQTAGLRPLRRKRSRKVVKRRRPRISAPAENDLDDRFSTLLVEIHKDLGNEGLQQAESIFQDFLESEDGGRLRTIEEQRNKLEGLVEINKAINSELDKSRLLNKIMDSAVLLTNAERGFIVLFDEGEFRIEAARNFDRESVINPAFKFSRSIAERVASTGASLLATDAQRDERFTDNMSVADLKLRSVACVPLKIHGEVFGVLYLDNRFQTGVFTPGDMAILESFGHQASIAIENARLHQDNLDRQEELRLSKEKVEELNRMLSKQVEEQKVELVRAKETLELNQKEFRSKYNYDNIVGTSKAMQTIFRLLDRITDSDVSVLIQGRSGTGKELVARAVHFNGPRRKMPFVSINCAAVSETLLESELFGHVRGAFTGAVRDKKGLFEFADKGTVFLDEISDMSHAMQTKLLRTLQEGEIRPVGGKNTKKVNVRILSASNKDLAQMVKDRHFREDLFYRLNVVRVNIPELQGRNEDIPLLVEHFLTVLSAETQREKLSVSREAMHCLTIHDWPGNVRELENEMRRVNALSDGIVEVEDLSENIRCTKTPPKPEMDIDRPLKEITRQAVEEIESEVIARALARTGWKKTQTARLLGISRPTLDAKIGQYNLRREDA